MRGLARQGVRGFRIVAGSQAPDRWLGGEPMAAMWQCGGGGGPGHLPPHESAVSPVASMRCAASFPKTPVVVDHFARIGIDGQIRREDLDNLCGLARHKSVRVKVSAFYALGKKKAPYLDLGPMIRRLLDAFGPERLMWASDSPFQVIGGHRYQDSIELVSQRLDFLTATDRDWLLRRTAEQTFFCCVAHSQITDDHPMVGVNRPLGGYRFGEETPIHPDLINAEQRETVRSRISPAVSRPTECVVQSLLERGERRVARRCIEVTAYDQGGGLRDGSDPLHDVQNLSAMSDSVVAVIDPEAGHPEIETEHRRTEANAHHFHVQTGGGLDCRVHIMRTEVHSVRLNTPAGKNRRVAAPHKSPVSTKQFSREVTQVFAARRLLKQHNVRFPCRHFRGGTPASRSAIERHNANAASVLTGRLPFGRRPASAANEALSFLDQHGGIGEPQRRHGKGPELCVSGSSRMR